MTFDGNISSSSLDFQSLRFVKLKTI